MQRFKKILKSPLNILRLILRKSISTFIYCVKLIFPDRGVIVLMYHRVNNNLEPNELVVSTQTFRQQMEYLWKQKYKIIGLDELVRELEDSHEPINKKTVMVTFDDGYRDNYLNAFPVLKELDFTATIFLTTGMIATHKKFDRYKDMASPDMLTWDEIRELSDYGIEFGAHTNGHPYLTRINLEEARRAILESGETIHTTFHNYTPIAFCYPYGDYNQEIKGTVKSSGFACAFTVEPGMNEKGCDLFELKRMAINGNDSLLDFKKKLFGI